MCDSSAASRQSGLYLEVELRGLQVALLRVAIAQPLVHICADRIRGVRQSPSQRNAIEAVQRVGAMLTWAVREQRLQLQQHIQVGIRDGTLRAALDLARQRDLPVLPPLQSKKKERAVQQFRQVINTYRPHAASAHNTGGWLTANSFMITCMLKSMSLCSLVLEQFRNARRMLLCARDRSTRSVSRWIRASWK